MPETQDYVVMVAVERSVAVSTFSVLLPGGPVAAPSDLTSRENTASHKIAAPTSGPFCVALCVRWFKKGSSVKPLCPPLVGKLL